MGSRPRITPDAPLTVAGSLERVVVGALDERGTYRTVRPSGTTDWLLLVTVSGCGFLRRPDGQELRLGPGSAALVEPRTAHDYGTDQSSGRWVFSWAHLEPRPDWVPLLDWPQWFPGLRQIELERTALAKVVDALDRAMTALRSAERRRLLLGSNAVEEALLWCDTQNPLHGAYDPRLMAAVEYLGNHLSEPLTVSSLARVAGLSSSRLAHLATAQLGVSVMRYVEERRIDLARQLLDLTDLSVGQIARQVGFSDPLYFSRRFRKATALSPSSYRAVRRFPQDQDRV